MKDEGCEAVVQCKWLIEHASVVQACIVDRRKGDFDKAGRELRFLQGSSRHHQYPYMRALSMCSGIAHLTVQRWSGVTVPS
jgi:hypothetical protein